MGKRDKKIDEYIAKSNDFAKPILSFIRETVHKGCPDVEEVIKWGFPNFVYNGGILCNMAAFKGHCSLGFWKAPILQKLGLLSEPSEKAMGQFGRLTKPSDLPSQKDLINIVKEASKLNDSKIKLTVVKKPAQKKILLVPDYLIKALNNNKNAKKTFENFSQSHRNEYIEWITEAKTEVTRDKRISSAIEWLEEGKLRNWKYLK